MRRDNDKGGLEGGLEYIFRRDFAQSTPIRIERAGGGKAHN